MHLLVLTLYIDIYSRQFKVVHTLYTCTQNTCQQFTMTHSLFWDVTRRRFVLGTTLRNIPEEQRPQTHHGGNLKSRTVCLHFICFSHGLSLVVFRTGLEFCMHVRVPPCLLYTSYFPSHPINPHNHPK